MQFDNVHDSSKKVARYSEEPYNEQPAKTCILRQEVNQRDERAPHHHGVQKADDVVDAAKVGGLRSKCKNELYKPQREVCCHDSKHSLVKHKSLVRTIREHSSRKQRASSGNVMLITMCTDKYMLATVNLEKPRPCHNATTRVTWQLPIYEPVYKQIQKHVQKLGEQKKLAKPTVAGLSQQPWKVGDREQKGEEGTIEPPSPLLHQPHDGVRNICVRHRFVQVLKFPCTIGLGLCHTLNVSKIAP